jgi:hypothetical protein
MSGADRGDRELPDGEVPRTGRPSVQDGPMDVGSGGAGKPVGSTPGQGSTGSDGTSRWHRSFVEQGGEPRGLSRPVVWVLLGLGLLIVVTFVIAA